MMEASGSARQAAEPDTWPQVDAGGLYGPGRVVTRLAVQYRGWVQVCFGVATVRTVGQRKAERRRNGEGWVQSVPVSIPLDRVDHIYWGPQA